MQEPEASTIYQEKKETENLRLYANKGNKISNKMKDSHRKGKAKVPRENYLNC